MNLLWELRRRFARALQPLTSDPVALAGLVKPTQDSRFGDFQANCAMPLAKQTGAAPRAVADRIVAGLDVADLCLPPEIAGPGFINLTLRAEWIEEAANRLIHDDRFGVDVTRDPKVVLIDYSGPNVAKPMHVGHIRSTLIGAALYRLFQFVGHRVQSDNHIGDWGTQFGMIIYGYKHFLDRDAYLRDPVTELGRLYRQVNQLADYWDAVEALPALGEQLGRLQGEVSAAEVSLKDASDKSAKAEAERILKRLRVDAETLRQELSRQASKRDAVERDAALRKLADEHPDVAVESRRETARLHSGDPQNLELWNEFLPQCLEALQAVYRRLDIEFDMALGESYYQPMLGEVVDSLTRSGLARPSDGATCVFIEENAAPFIIRKSDGAFTYATTDLATIRYRAEILKASVILYVVDARQSEHFRLLFATARQWGYDQIDYRHVSFGTILGEDKRPFKTRSGDTVGLEGFLDEALLRARRIVDDNDDAKETPELDDRARAAVAETVGIGGIKYADLRHNRDSDYVFQWDKMLATTGDTATYIQYSFARICGIFRKGGIDREVLRNSGSTIRLSLPTERRLALQLLRLPESVDLAIEDCRPNYVTQFLFATADCFTKFYEECPVLKEPDAALRDSRLLLCDLTARVLQKGLWLLGIRTSEQM
jgi:arginyl-tRNA synthetase